MSELEMLQCPACGARLNYGGGPETIVACDYCGTKVALPVDLRPRDTAAETPRPTAAGPYMPEAPPGALVLTGAALAKALADWLLTQASEQTGVKLNDDPMAQSRIAAVAEKVLHELSTQEAIPVSLPYLAVDARGARHFETRITRRLVDELARTTCR
jgi:hypothetical protein